MATKYGQIAHDLRESITSREYKPGETLPAIVDLMARYGVARDTVRDALSLLSNEGLVLPQRGRGTVVRETDPVALHYSPAAPARTWMQQTAGAGTDTVLETEWESADPDIAARLDVAPGANVVHRVRQFRQGHGVGQVTDQWFPEAVARAVAGVAGDLTSEHRPDTGRTVFDLLTAAGYAPASTTEDLTVRMPDPSERDAMELSPGVPVLVTRRITRTSENTPVETTTAVGAGDRMSASFTVTLNY